MTASRTICRIKVRIYTFPGFSGQKSKVTGGLFTTPVVLEKSFARVLIGDCWLLVLFVPCWYLDLSKKWLEGVFVRRVIIRNKCHLKFDFSSTPKRRAGWCSRPPSALSVHLHSFPVKTYRFDRVEWKTQITELPCISLATFHNYLRLLPSEWNKYILTACNIICDLFHLLWYLWSQK